MTLAQRAQQVDRPPALPMVFVRGVLVGGFVELHRLIDSGELKRVLGEP
jgi:monothiol glutaredoxin